MARRRLLALVAAVATAAATLATAPVPAQAATGGSLTIVVDTNPADGTDVGFTGCQGAACGPFVLDDDTDATRSDRTTATDLAPGTYTVTQDAVAGWTLTSLACSTSTGVTKDVANRRVTIALTAGQNVTCTFTDQSPSITILQDSSPDDARDFSYTSCLGSGCGTFALDDDTDAAVPSRISGSGLALGTYTITQAVDGRWSLSTLSCSGGSAGSWVDRDRRTATIVLSAATAHATCTFTDVTQSLTIVDDDLIDSGQDHGYTGCGTAGCSSFTLDDDADPTNPRQVGSGPVPAGTYTVTQDTVPGWELTGLVCPGESTDLLARTGTVTLAAGEHRTCTFTNRPTPAPLTGVADITIGYRHACARLTDGQARCWGDKVLGDGRYDASTSPRVVVDPSGAGPLTGVVDLAAGSYHTCAALSDGHAVCWGTNAAGELGNGTVDAGPVPVMTPTYVVDDEGAPLTGVIAVAAGFYRSCAVLTSGEARCWGDGTSGALGNGSVSGSAVPVTVMDGAHPLSGVAEMVTGQQFSCARLLDGTVRCWGYGATGNGSSFSFSPVTVATDDPLGEGPLTGVSAISGNWSHACGLREVGRVACWGGDLPTFSGRTSPWPVPLRRVDVSPVDDAAALADGERVTCVARGDGTASCWGADAAALGGGPSVTGWATEITVLEQRTGAPLTDVASVSAGSDTTCAVLTNGEARCWGIVTGDGTSFTRNHAVPVVAGAGP